MLFADDLDISPDFFDYFLATYPVLHADASLWCVSAWNDNGKADLVSDEPGLSPSFPASVQFSCGKQLCFAAL